MATKGPVLICWEDSQSPATGDWLWLNEIDADNLTVKSVGWIVLEDRKSITLAAHVATNGQMTGIMSIPRSAIRGRIKRLS